MTASAYPYTLWIFHITLLALYHANISLYCAVLSKYKATGPAVMTPVDEAKLLAARGVRTLFRLTVRDPVLTPLHVAVYAWLGGWGVDAGFAGGKVRTKARKGGRSILLVGGECKVGVWLMSYIWSCTTLRIDHFYP